MELAGRIGIGFPLAGLAALVLLVAPAGARADERVIAGPLPLSYLTTSVTIDQGERLSFLNLDLTALHDVTAIDTGRDRRPLFRSETIPAPNEAEVMGADSLRKGDYPFFCSLHPFMTGTLHVTSAGSPTPGLDVIPPELRVRIADSTVREVVNRGALKTKVEVSEDAGVALSARAQVDGEKVRLGRTRTDLEDAGRHAVKVRLSRDGKRALKGEHDVPVLLSGKAEDRAKNTSGDRDRRTLK